MKTYYCPVIDPTYHSRASMNKRGLFEAFGRSGGVCQLDYIAYGSGNLAEHVAYMLQLDQYDLLFLQVNNQEYFTAQDLIHFRTINPNLKIVNWNGDVWDHGLISPALLELLKHVDLQLVVNASALPTYEAAGIKAHYWTHGIEPVGQLPLVPAYDVLFLGNCYSEKRAQLGKILEAYCASHDLHLGLYGSGWGEQYQQECNYDFAMQQALYRACRVAISDNQFPEAIGAFSNRLFTALAAGAFVLHQHTEGIEEYAGFVHNINYVEWSDFDNLIWMLDYWTTEEAKLYRAELSNIGRTFVLQNHTYDCRVKQLMEWLK